MPDVCSIRHTTVEDHVERVAHEIKVRRADLLSDLRREAEAAAHLAWSSRCWYVLRADIAEPDEVPAACGVMLADEAGLNVARPAPRRAMRLPLAVWMALARAIPVAASEDDEQAPLVAANSALHLARQRPIATEASVTSPRLPRGLKSRSVAHRPCLSCGPG